MSLTTAFANAAAGDRINIKSGTYTRGSNNSDTPANNGTVASPIWYRGYGSAIGDGYQGRTGSTGIGVLVATNMPTIAYSGTGRLVSTGTFTIYESLTITGSASSLIVTQSADSLFKSSSITNSGTNAACIGIAIGGRSTLFDCDAQLTGASGGNCAVQMNNANAAVMCCRITGGPNIGISSSIGTTQGAIIGNLIFASTGNQIAIITTTTNRHVIYGNTIVGGGADGINILTGSTLNALLVVNNMITDNTGDGIDMVSTSNAAILGYNRTRDNGGSAVNNGGDWTTATTYSHVTTDTGGASTDYVNSGSNDYRLISTSPGKGVGYFPYLDIGAFQRIEPTGSGGSFTFGG